MSIFLRVLRRAIRYATKIQSRWYRHRLLLLEEQQHKRLTLGDNNLFDVPVRGGGCGTLSIGNSNVLGCRPAARLGTGEILLQARHSSSEISIGDRNLFSNNVSIIANERVTIGNDCQIGELVSIYDSDFHEINPETRNRSHGPTKPVTIGNNVWLGSRVIVLKGVTIGDNSVVAAMSVVNKSIPPNYVAAGIPARSVRKIGQPETV